MTAEGDFSVDPFPNLVMRGFFDDDLIDRAAAEFPDRHWPGWQWYLNDKEWKAARREPVGPATREIIELMRSPKVTDLLGAAFEIEDLIPSQEGGGLHMIPTGGYLAIHADFNRGETGLYRRVNCLLYLNRGWQPEWGGGLELWRDEWASGPSKVIAPEANVMAAFATSSTSYHGHPHPHTAPVPRKSIAVYYFTEQPPPDVRDPHSTIFI